MSTDTEAAITGSRRTSLGLGDAAREFWRHPSPWIIGGLLVAATAARVAVAEWALSDALVVAIALAAFPFYEWVVHVCILHWRPRHVGRITFDPLVARKHRLHHADPRDVPLIFIPWRVLAWVIPIDVAIGLFAFPRLATGLTFLLTVGVLGIAYEWTHYLVHTDYRPRSRPFRAIWRHHRLHHYKSEHYWFGVATAGVSDRVLGTAPDPAKVATSPTVRSLHARESD
jgi:hypothetical protein